MYLATVDATPYRSYLFSWAISQEDTITPGSGTVSADSIGAEDVIADLCLYSHYTGITTTVGQIILAGGQASGSRAVTGTFTIPRKFSVVPGDDLRLTRRWPYGEATNVHLAIKTSVASGNSFNLDAALAGKEDTTNRGQAGGYAALDNDGKVPVEQIPARAILSVSAVGSEAALLALEAQEGDVVKRVDEDTWYIHNGGDAGDLSDWDEFSGQNPNDGQLGLEFDVPGSPANGDVVFRHRVVTDPFSIVFNGSGLVAGVAVPEGWVRAPGSASTVFSLRRNGSEFAQLMFGSSQNTAQVMGDEDTTVSFAAGDILEVVSLGSAPGFEDALVTLVGSQV